MIRSFAVALLLVACTQARTDGTAASGAPSPSSPPVAPSPSRPLGGDAAVSNDPSSSTSVRKVGDGGKGIVEQYVDPTPVTRERSPADDLAKQIGGAHRPAQGGRSLAVVKRSSTLGPSSSLDASSMEFDYVARGQRDVEKCFDALRAKDPAAKGEITLRFTVDTKGAVVDPEVTGFSAEVSTCVRGAMPQWKFTAPNKSSRFELILGLIVG